MVPLRHCTREKRVKEGRVLDLFLMQALCSSSPSVSMVEEICWVCMSIVQQVEARRIIGSRKRTIYIMLNDSSLLHI